MARILFGKNKVPILSLLSDSGFRHSREAVFIDTSPTAKRCLDKNTHFVSLAS
ncbi:hypothetical protein OK016_28735 [Vibrio chagasii]|nr:hypothetical protein [Vibrio chagasii]